MSLGMDRGWGRGKGKKEWLALLVILLLAVIGGGSWVLGGTIGKILSLVPGEPFWRTALTWGVPVISWEKSKGEIVNLPRLAMAFQFPFLTGEQALAASLVSTEGEDDSLKVEPAPLPMPGDGGGAAVLIYNTHNGETYTPTAGVPRLDGKNAGVAMTAGVIASALQDDYGISVARSTTIHDAPSYNDSYKNSMTTVQKLLKENPQARMVLDIHRDATPDRATVTIDGKASAKILFIIGTDARASHPNWKKNYELAQLINQRLEKEFPGLSRGVRTKDGRYHQQFHPGALLVEIGSDKNSLPEAEEAARHLSKVLAEILKESPGANPVESPAATPKRNQGIQAWIPFSFDSNSGMIWEWFCEIC